LNCRGVRLDRFAALGLALAMSALAAMPALAAAGSQATQTRLTAEIRDQSGRSRTALSITVAGEDGLPASGTVTIEDEGKPLAGAALNAEGTAQVTLGLLPGSHALRAVYAGDAVHEASTSDLTAVSAAASSAPDFTVSVSPASLTLTAGQTGNVTASVTPVNAAALTAPTFVTLSCSGMPDQSSCAFTPENVEILPNATAAISSSLVITTQATGTRGMAAPPARPVSNAVAWAVLLPGAFSLAGLAFAARRRRWASRLLLVALVGLVSVLGATACAPRYNYFNHGPPYNLPTPAGSYTIQIAAQSSNGVSATTHTAPFALTVK
jgi:Bacterial Ig-like domain (group 3)